MPPTHSVLPHVHCPQRVCKCISPRASCQRAPCCLRGALMGQVRSLTQMHLGPPLTLLPPPAEAQGASRDSQAVPHSQHAEPSQVALDTGGHLLLWVPRRLAKPHSCLLFCQPQLDRLCAQVCSRKSTVQKSTPGMKSPPEGTSAHSLATFCQTSHLPHCHPPRTLRGREPDVSEQC